MTDAQIAIFAAIIRVNGICAACGKPWLGHICTAPCPACDNEGEVLLFTGPAPCPECHRGDSAEADRA